MRDSDWSRQILLRSDWLVPRVALITTGVDRNPEYQSRCSTRLTYRRLEGVKARFRGRTFHEPNLVRIKAEPNDLDRLNRFRRGSYLQLNYVQKA